ncbi:MAG: hypothetical protein KatS3mg014_2435 [Actinomycetota bacterium]|nr:MAG: hypothetical protein KatS3mg014_2435 [Actinomycetota bacterium]
MNLRLRPWRRCRICGEPTELAECAACRLADYEAREEVLEAWAGTS